MPTLDRPKQENFAQYFVETGNASEAYRKAYKADGMKPETVHRKAKELMDNGKITARIEELQAEHIERHKLTVDDLLDELEVAREKALERGQLSVAVSATMGKAKLLGLDKQTIDHTSSDKTFTSIRQTMTPSEFEEIARKLLEEV
ncbi:terminase small subunit [Glaesserella parasuis]|uniref:terminase small subunit n=1 Tax=Glaesserella parasuis TaxID=738 RepID=UPI001F165108|nr:terminase small subunit [Glaesserella parasuis]MDG6430251.1 terminase small subunit [Glaesserella parasuis]MDG6766254.1 terminase small subunit [Glaesserella parasuis]MDO9790598.1 terminase small subunit [Glaesserella parasuis]MDP0098301.1 terminase small subunit [Glaesserella parasuis]MDP0308466.1 terminase small subunit [Glaesserella parasuis]